MKAALAQFNPIPGDLPGNVRRMEELARQASRQNAELVVFPEMALVGYPPRDILLDASFPPAALNALDDLAARLRGYPPVLVGAPAPAPTSLPRHPNLFNAVWLLQNGRAQLAAAKRLLPAYDVFHEPRWFVPGNFSPPLSLAGRTAGIVVCEDLWDEGYPLHPAAELKAAGADLLICLSASPYRQGVFPARVRHARRAAGETPLLFVNQSGANDELIFDGRSFSLQADELQTAPAFEECLWLAEISAPRPAAPAPIFPAEEILPDLAAALSLGIRDFARKNNLTQAVIGLSGGIDSSLAAVLAVRALGPENVLGLALPSRYTRPESTQAAQELCRRLGCRLQVVELEPLHRAFEETVSFHRETVMENAQARLRMTILMAFVNELGGFLLNTSNKTELTVGYSTLYGDQAGALCPLGDLTKPQVYALAQHVGRGLIPAFVFERPPSAELRPQQVDPFDYPVFSPRMELLVQANQSNPAMRHSEHKRWQAGVILKVSETAFGSGRLMPITRR